MLKSRRWRMVGLGLVVLMTTGLYAGIAYSSKVKLEVWLNDNVAATRDFLNKQMIPAFEKENPNITIKMVYINWERFYEKLTTSYAAGAPPDVIEPGGEDLGMMVKHGLARPLDDLLADWPAKDDFYDSTWETATYKGRIYRVPLLADVRSLIYRKDFFQEAGLDPDTPPETWEELADYAVKLTKRSAEKIKRAGYHDWTYFQWQEFFYFMWQNGGEITNKEMTKVTLDSPECIEALQFLSDLSSKYKVMPLGGITAPGALPLVGAGIAAMQRSNATVLAETRRYAPKVYDKLGVALPTKKKLRRAGVYVNALVIVPLSVHQKEAWEFIKFWVKPANMLAFDETLFQFPPRKSVAKLFVEKYPELDNFRRVLLEYGTAPVPVPSWGEMYMPFTRAVEAARYGKKTPEQALREYADELRKLLKEEGLL